MGTVIFNIDFVDKLSMDYKANNLSVEAYYFARYSCRLFWSIFEI